MSEDKLPAEVRNFIADYIDTALQLEILLLLRQQAERKWSASDLEKELRVGRDWVESQFEELFRRGLLARDRGREGAAVYQYAPADAKLASAVAALATWYSTHRVAIISIIYSKPTDRLRIFADAFRLRKDKPNG